MIRSASMLAVIVAMTTAHLAFAQDRDVRALATEQIVNFCVATPEMANEPDAAAKCHCAAQIVAAEGTERELTIFTRVFAFFPDQDAARAEMQRMIDAEGYAPAEFNAVTALLNRWVSAVGDRCDG